MVLNRDVLLEHTVPAQPHSNAGKTGQPTVVVSAAKAQAEAAAVIAHGGDQCKADVRSREKGGVRRRLQDSEGRWDQGAVRVVQPHFHLAAGQHPGQTHPLAPGGEGLDQTAGLRLAARDAPEGKYGGGRFHLGQGRKGGEQGIVAAAERVRGQAVQSQPHLAAQGGLILSGGSR